MPALTPTEKTVAATELRVIRGYELGLAAVGETIFVAMEIESGGDKRTYIMSLASAVTFCADMTAVIESDEGIGALVTQTLSDARAMKREAAAADRVADEYLADVAAGREEG